jgi:hypothetical protein
MRLQIYERCEEKGGEQARFDVNIHGHEYLIARSMSKQLLLVPSSLVLCHLLLERCAI